MKCEGRVMGSYVKLRKHQPEGLKAPTKLNNHSKITSRCPGNKSRSNSCPSGHASGKAMNKAKGESKAKGNDIASKHRLDEWRVCYSLPCPSSTGESQSTALDADFEYYSDYEESASEDELSLEEKENNQRTAEMVLPIHTFLRTMRNARRMLPPVREVASEEGSAAESDVDSDSSWSGVEISEVERSADLDDWYVVS